MSDMDAKICGTQITGRYIAELMKTSLGQDAVLASTIAEKTATSQGLWSNIVRINLTWENNQIIGLPDKVLAKIPVVELLYKLLDVTAEEEDKRAKTLISQAVSSGHRSECNVYNMFGNCPPVVLPKCYGAVPITDDAPGIIILEDLSDRAALASSFIHGMTYPQLLETVTELARLHAWSLTTSIDWHSQLPKLEEYEKILRGFFAPSADGYKQTKAQYPKEFESLDVETCSKLTSYENFVSISTEHRQFMGDILVHGDAHLNNLLFEKKADGGTGDRLIALLDFQLAAQGSPGYDIARLLNYSVSHRIRREHYDDILRRYYDTVKSIAGDKFEATFDQLRVITDRLFALAALATIACYQPVMNVMVKSEGEQKVKDERVVLERMKANYDDALEIFGV